MKEIELTTADLREIKEEGYPISMSVTEARKLIETLPEEYEELVSALDSAQGAVFTNAKAATYIVIKIEE